ncbi:TRAP transporter small permease subunit [Nitratireductor sp.]|uniref:TRAP transporter small permease subunit n=1 Tax=Nitratireductor sp. TaxID=1872084 RepID=UPI0025F711D5|nr:TRAP transporter small permease subunit [Nitratireductor sp.]
MSQRFLTGFSDSIDRFNDRLGRWGSWLIGVLILIQFLVVVLRYVFGLGSIKLQESIIYTHAVVLMFLAAYTLRHDGHVRLDIFYSAAKTRSRALLDLLGGLLYLLPMCVFMLYVTAPYVGRSWSVLEGSRELSGLPGVYLVKTSMLFFAILLLAQGLSMIARAWLVYRYDEPDTTDGVDHSAGV